MLALLFAMKRAILIESSDRSTGVKSSFFDVRWADVMARPLSIGHERALYRVTSRASRGNSRPWESTIGFLSPEEAKPCVFPDINALLSMIIFLANHEGKPILAGEIKELKGKSPFAIPIEI